MRSRVRDARSRAPHAALVVGIATGSFQLLTQSLGNEVHQQLVVLNAPDTPAVDLRSAVGRGTSTLATRRGVNDNLAGKGDSRDGVSCDQTKNPRR